MPLSEKEILRFLMQSRERISAAAWLVVKDTHVTEDIFQNSVLKAVTNETRSKERWFVRKTAEVSRLIILAYAFNFNSIRL